jgi:murein L,D-transpeptidase YcbB/YkuD
MRVQILRKLFQLVRPLTKGRRRRGACRLLGLLTLAATPTWAAAPALNTIERAAIYGALGGSDEIGDARSLADAELWALLERHAVVELGQRIRPSDIDPMWATNPSPRTVPRELEQAHAQGRLINWIAGLPVPAAQYRALASVRGRYRTIAGLGGWPTIQAGTVLHKGMGGTAIAELRARLAIEGYLDASDPAAPFDDALAAALANFQRHHNLVPDGVVGEATRHALNVSAEDRLSQIEANLERWRWVRDLPADRLEVDVAAAEASLYLGGVVALSMRVIVGDPKHRTPLFTTRLASIVLNPPWNVPTSIADKELLPREAANPGYLAANGFTRVNGGLRQAPGAKNALGQVKFDFPSPFGVYLHDTPARSLFAQSRRTLSHGCVRLEKPRELALALLASRGWTRETLDSAITTGETQSIRLPVELPLIIVYRTVLANPNGSLTFRRDPYDWDAKLIRALAAPGPPVAMMARAESECSVSKPPQAGL